MYLSDKNEAFISMRSSSIILLGIVSPELSYPSSVSRGGGCTACDLIGGREAAVVDDEDDDEDDDGPETGTGFIASIAS